MGRGVATVLGSGTSTGVPVLGRSYPAEFLADPRNHRTRPSLLMQGPEGNLLVDCGADMRTQLLREGVTDIEAVLITHSHADNIMGMDDLRAFTLKYRRAVPVYIGDEAKADVARVFPYMFAEFPPEILVPRVDFRPIEPEMRVCGMDLQTAWVWHGKIPVVAVRCRGFAYVTDVKLIPPEAEPLMAGLETLVIDAVRIRPHPHHMNLEEALAAVERFRPSRTFLTHLADDYDHGPSEALLPDGVALAYDGLRIEF